ncbi:hypothetical protein KAM622c_31250 [Klebsiella quasipneumoniae subsp. quasipneumoniae]|nr:hypothetical protein KAM622c_31250 [Klebsiella quasipneumoniae subsp. quasipneumoniae]
MNMKSGTAVFIHLLSDTYSAEKQLTRGLAKLARAASSEKLSAAFNAHLEETQGQIERIDQIIEQESGLKIKRMKCVESMLESMAGRIDNYPEEKNEVRDAALIAAAQKVEHYEIASYGTLVTLAEQLGYKKAVKLLAETLEEEKQTDVKLTDLSVYVFEQFEIACYTSLLAAAEKAGDTVIMTGYEMRMPWKNRQNPCWNQWLAVSIIIRISVPESNSILMRPNGKLPCWKRSSTATRFRAR